jgi:hypothetical protein
MLKFTSVLGSDQATTDITHTGTTILTVITTGRTGVTPITGRIMGTEGIVTTDTIVTIDIIRVAE